MNKELSVIDSPKAREIYKHKKRGTLYRTVGIGKLQVDDKYLDDCPVVIYAEINNPYAFWVRPVADFVDGRFEFKAFPHQEVGVLSENALALIAKRAKARFMGGNVQSSNTFAKLTVKLKYNETCDDGDPKKVSGKLIFKSDFIAKESVLGEANGADTATVCDSLNHQLSLMTLGNIFDGRVSPNQLLDSLRLFRQNAELGSDYFSGVREKLDQLIVMLTVKLETQNDGAAHDLSS